MGTKFLYGLLLAGFKLFSPSKCFIYPFTNCSIKKRISEHDYAIVLKYLDLQ